ncbi:uncharacterized protein LOC142345110 isoform X2 [Convolutriloba macropyga]|uniref:uncharacterized protein LOC142345110 isoform X2 n=1 Tax=Convolutriloba macropyga TaxID=536237 RepID=UPI003F51EE71
MIQTLPDTIVMQILSYLSYFDDIFAVSLTCIRLHELSQKLFPSLISLDVEKSAQFVTGDGSLFPNFSQLRSLKLPSDISFRNSEDLMSGNLCLNEFMTSCLIDLPWLQRLLDSQAGSLRSLHLKLQKGMPSDTCVQLLPRILIDNYLPLLKNLTIVFDKFHWNFSTRALLRKKVPTRMLESVKLEFKNTSSVLSSQKFVESIEAATRTLEVQFYMVTIRNLSDFPSVFTRSLTSLKCDKNSSFNVCSLVQLCPVLKFLGTCFLFP